MTTGESSRVDSLSLIVRVRPSPFPQPVAAVSVLLLVFLFLVPDNAIELCHFKAFLDPMECV